MFYFVLWFYNEQCRGKNREIRKLLLVLLIISWKFTVFMEMSANKDKGLKINNFYQDQRKNFLPLLLI